MRAWVVLAAALLASCVSTDEWAEREDATCRSYGAKPGEPAYIACRMKLKDDRPSMTKLVLYGSSTGQGGGSAPSQEQPQTVTRLGGPSYAMCMKTGEQFGQGYKVCRYNCGGSAAVLNVGVGELCPLNPD